MKIFSLNIFIIMTFLFYLCLLETSVLSEVARYDTSLSNFFFFQKTELEKNTYNRVYNAPKNYTVLFQGKDSFPLLSISNSSLSMNSIILLYKNTTLLNSCKNSQTFLHNILFQVENYFFNSLISTDSLMVLDNIQLIFSEASFSKISSIVETNSNSEIIILNTSLSDIMHNGKGTLFHTGALDSCTLTDSSFFNISWNNRKNDSENFFLHAVITTKRTVILSNMFLLFFK